LSPGPPEPSRRLLATDDTTGNRTLIAGIQATARARRPDLAESTAGTPRLGDWHSVGPFPAGSAREAYEKAFGPENGIDLAASFLDGKLAWVKRDAWRDGDVVPLSGENAAHYLYRTIAVPAAQVRTVALGSHDGIQVWLTAGALATNTARRRA
jgi:hypothetical protein